MERWEHMTMATSQAKSTPAAEVEIHLTQGPGFQPVLIPAEQPVQGSRAIRQLDILGADGWQLVETERQDQDNVAIRIFWLKRRVQ
jgi:hypothetical protein